MDFRKFRSTINRPLDYLKERNISSSIRDKSSFGTSQIGWESRRLRDTQTINGNYKGTILYLDNISKNKFTDHSGNFVSKTDKDLNMKKGFPFNKLDKRRQKRLIKNADILLSRTRVRREILLFITS